MPEALAKPASRPDFPWIPDDESALEQFLLLQPEVSGVGFGFLNEPAESGQLTWRKDDFRVFWIFRSELYNIGARGNFREQMQTGCCVLIPPGLPVFFWREGNISYCNDLAFDGRRYDVTQRKVEEEALANLGEGPKGSLAIGALAFKLNEHLAKLAMPIFRENTILRVEGPEFDMPRVVLEQILRLPNKKGVIPGQLTKTFLMGLISAAQQTRQLVLTNIPREAAENQHIMEVLRIVSERLDDGSLNLESIAHAVDLNPSYLSGLFSQLMNKTLVRYIQEKRVLAARRLLLTNPHLSIKEIMAQVGINTPQQMSRTFKKILGCSPTEFRERLE